MANVGELKKPSSSHDHGCACMVSNWHLRILLHSFTHCGEVKRADDGKGRKRRTLFLFTFFEVTLNFVFCFFSLTFFFLPPPVGSPTVDFWCWWCELTATKSMPRSSPGSKIFHLLLVQWDRSMGKNINHTKKRTLSALLYSLLSLSHTFLLSIHKKTRIWVHVVCVQDQCTWHHSSLF